jgi:hypothetical protein
MSPVPDPTYITKNYRERGGARDVVQGELDLVNGGLLRTNGVAMTPAGGQYTVTAGDVTATTKTIATGLASAITSFNVQIIRAGKVATSDAAVSTSGANLIVANGSTFTLTSGDLIVWLAFGQ